MAGHPPDRWPAPEDVALPDEDDEESLIHEQEASQAQENVVEGKGKEQESLGKGKRVAVALPSEILETILYFTDPDTFASLVLVDHAWRSASQTPHLYAYHLSRCPSFSRSHNVLCAPFTEDSLPHLKRLFAREVKRNLFEAYLQPRRTLVSLISRNTTSSAALPGAEAFDFCFSPKGHWVLALSSSRIYVIDSVSPKLSVQRELKVLRRPISTAILDDGSILAVLSSDHRVNIYDLTNVRVKHLRAVALDNPPHALALAPKGEVLAAAFDGGIEVHSLNRDAVGLDHRAIKCDRVDCLIFSEDGTMLLGTTKNSKNPSTVVLSAPYYTEDHEELPPSDQVSHLWTSQILFPNSSRDCSNATLLPNRSDGDANWTFTYDKVFESFRAVRTDDLRNGTTYFTGPKPPSREGPRNSRKKLTPCTLPTSSCHGELVAAGFFGKEVWLYGVPEGLDTSCISQGDDPNSQTGWSAGSSTSSSIPRSPARDFTRGEAAEITELPKWQVLVDKYRNVFAKGRRIAEISGVSGVCWVSNRHERAGSQSLGERLVITAPGGVPGHPELEQDGFASVDGGRLIILDFDRTAGNGIAEEITFEVGNDTPELLEEADLDIDTEVALARQRTVKREVGSRATVADVLVSAPAMPSLPSLAPSANAIANAGTSAPHGVIPITPAEPMIQGAGQNEAPPGEDLSLEEASEVFDGPYSHTQPRSRTSLYRSATAVAANRQRNTARPRIVDEGRVQFRRPGDHTELPHESDADNWVPPPPPYTAKSDRPLPEELRLTLLPRATELGQRLRPALGRDRPRRARTVYENPAPVMPSRRISSFPSRPPMSLRRRSLEASTPVEQSQRSVSGSASETLGAISRLSTMRSSFGDELRQPSNKSRRPFLSSNRRPVSAFVGRVTTSLQRPHASHIAPLEPQPPMPQRPAQSQSQSVSLPSTPTRHEESPTSPLTLTGANLQQRLEYPLPPAPTNSSVESLNRRYSTTAPPHNSPRTEPSAYQQRLQDLNSIAASVPSAQQLTNLQSRFRQPPTSRAYPPGLVPQGGYPIPAPPRGALGATGSPTSVPLHSPSRSLSNRNSFARSSPALLRPTPRRLDTIESVSSFISRPGTRNGGRSRSRDLTTVSSGDHGRSQSVGPALRLDRVHTEGFQKRGLFGGKKKVKKGGDEQNIDDGYEKGGKCLVM